MKNQALTLLYGALLAFVFASIGFCQSPICTGPNCQIAKPGVIEITTLIEEVSIDDSQPQPAANVDRFAQTILATVRCTVSGVCGSGTVVGRDPEGNALVLTNAHVAGTQRGRVINVERWNLDGSSERSTGAIIAAGYGRGMSVDFALLKCKPEFAKGVAAVPMANRYPDPTAIVATYGCPRCEWPSLQVLKLNRREGQILSWKPEAIGGRSGSSVCDFTEAGPRVVGLLTWGGGGEGLGQSAPFLLNAMKGILPKSLEPLPMGIHEVSDENNQAQRYVEFEAPRLMTWPVKEMSSDEDLSNSQTPPAIIDQILEQPEDKPLPNEGGLFRPNPDKPKIIDRPTQPRPSFLGGVARWFRDRLLVLALVVVAFVGGFAYRAWLVR